MPPEVRVLPTKETRTRSYSREVESRALCILLLMGSSFYKFLQVFFRKTMQTPLN